MIQAIISAIVTALTEFGTGTATFLNEFVTELVFVAGEGGATELTPFASWGLAFLGLSLVLGLGGMVFGMVFKRT